MTLLQPAVSSSAFLKQGLLGFQGGGKSLTGALTLIGLYKYTQKLGLNDGTKPVAMFDTEKGSDWLIPVFKAAGVPFVVAKQKTFADLITVIKEAEAHAFGLLIDSITHPWRELVESYLRKKQRSYLQMDDWGYLKGEHGWQQFTDLYVNSKLHIIMAGRAGYEYETYVEDGRKKMDKVGTKMKTEGETGFEPDLLVMMEPIEDLRTGKVKHRATVQKDRSTLIDGQQFDFEPFDIKTPEFWSQTFNSFLPHIKCLALGAPHIGVGASGDSQHMLKIEKRDWQPVQRKIVHDEITTLLTLHYPSQTAEHKTAKLKALIKHFDASWTEIEEVMPLDRLRAGYDSLYRELEEGKPSRYAIGDEGSKPEINDEIPGLEGAPVIAGGGAHTMERPLLDKLTAQLATLNTTQEILHFALEAAQMPGLTDEDRRDLSNAIMARQNEVGRQAKPEEPKPEGEKPTEEKPAGKKREGKPAVTPEEALVAG